MEIRHLRYFVAVVDAGNFTRAAEQLGISQPPLSQQIQRLEHEIGAPLLRRLTRSIELTEAGKTLYDDAVNILKLTDVALERARSVARGVSGTLRIGFASSTAFNPQVFSLLHRFRDHYPAMALLPQEKEMSALMTALADGAIDVAFIRLPCERSKDFACRVIDFEQMVVALPHAHPLAQRESIALAMLKEETLITFPRDVSPSLYDSVIAACNDAGFTPKLGQQSPQVTSAISMVATGFGYAVVPASLGKIDDENVTCLPLKGPALTTQVALAWRRNDNGKAVMRFLKLLEAQQ